MEKGRQKQCWTLLTVALAGAITLTASACSSKPTGEAKQEPVTLKFYTGDKDYEQRFKTDIEAKVKSKYPYISFEFQGADQGKEIQDLVAAGASPDIYYQGISALNEKLVKFDLQYDLTELIKKSNYDLSRSSLRTEAHKSRLYPRTA
jgi:ABC-type glycerol-3-phosphate transport system substrate-binding protein